MTRPFANAPHVAVLRPLDAGEIPMEVCRLRFLTALNLAHNMLTGEGTKRTSRD